MVQSSKYRLNNLATVIFLVELILWGILALYYFLIMPNLPRLRFDRGNWFWILAATSLFSVVFYLVYRWKNKALSRFGDETLIPNAVPNISTFKIITKYVLLRLAFFFLVIGLINPKYGNKMVEAKFEGIDIMLALDVSNSMRAEDLSPNRLVRAKRAIEQLMDRLHGDQIGIVVFAGDAFVQLPITNDYAAAGLFLSTIETDIIPGRIQGTAIGRAIDLSVESFDPESTSSKTIVVITDGENHEDDAIGSARAALEKNITVHSIGMGSSKGSPIPEFKNGRKAGYKKDKEGNTVVSKLNVEMLKDISNAGGGTYIQANDINVGLDELVDELEGMDKETYGVASYEDYEDRFQNYLALSLLFLVLDVFVTEKRSKWMNQINLFD